MKQIEESKHLLECSLSLVLDKLFHDTLFHSVLGLMGIKAGIYD
jgi:hypothetical protein